MARAAVIPGVSDPPPPRTTRGRGRTPTITPTTTDTEDVSSKSTDQQQPAKRGRKPGKTTAGTTSSASAKTAGTKTSEKKKKTTTTTTKSMTVNEDDDLGLEVVTTTSKRGGGGVKAAAPRKSNNARVSKKGEANADRTATTGKYEEQEEDVDRDGNSDDDDDDELADFEVMTRKSTQSVKTKTSTASVPTKSTRGRRPKATNTIDESARDVVEVTDKKTKGRRAATQSTVGESKSKTLYITPASMTSSLAKHQIAREPSRKKKQVTFADLTDSENEQSANEDEEEEEEEEQPAKSTAKITTAKSSKSTGLKANPVRKAGTATRGRPPKSRTTAAVKPLSPKKTAQLAKGSTTTSASSGDEDELAPKKSKPVYSLVVQKSPSKTAAELQHTGLSSPVKKVFLPGQTATPARSPVRPASSQDENLIPDARDLQLSSILRDAMLIGTPARRPPSSTSKETFRDTPRRGPLFITSATVSKFADNTATSSFMQTLSPLKSSPKKGVNFGASFLSAASEKEMSTPFNAKSSLLKSPAKRIQSPFIYQKVTANRDDARAETQTAVSEDVDSEMLDDGDSVVVDDIVDATSTEHQGKENEITMDEQTAEVAEDEDDVFVDHAIAEACDSRPDNDEMPKEDHLSTDSADSLHGTDLADGNQANVEEQQDDYVEEDVEMTQNGYDDAEHEVDDRQDLVKARESVDIDEPEFQSGNDTETRDEVNESNELGRIQETNEHTDPSRSSSDHMEQEPYSEQVDIEEDNNQMPLETESTTSPTAIYVESTKKKEINDAGNDTPRSQYSTRSSTAGDVIYPNENDDLSSERTAETPRSVPPLVPTPRSFSVRHHFRASYRDQHIDDLNSEYGSSPASRRQSTFSSRDSILPHGPDDTFTSLATHLSSWKASSPEKRRNQAPASSIFSPVVPEKLATPRQFTRADKFSQIQSLRQSLAARHSMAKTIILDGDEPDTVERQDIKENVHKGIEMAVQPQLPFSMSLTPVRLNRGEIRTVHTVSKVPLKPEAEESPLKNRRKRAHSMSMNIQLPIRASPGRVKLVPKSRKSPSASPLPSSSILTSSGVESSQEQKVHEPMPVSPAQNSPMKTPRPDAKTDKQCLRGAVVLVDVHTTEGEDASGIFVELLTQMGAKCVKSWSWNPRSSQSPGVDGSEAINTSKVGITHVVYKDGGVRTMEKVRQAGDLVKCVGVGWVLDCERANKWIDEAHYYVDSTIIPRGGAKRRKSMQPRALANVNGTIFSPSSSSSSLSSSTGFSNSIGSTRRLKAAAEMEETMEDFKRMSPSSSVNSINNSTRTPTTPLPPPPRQDTDQSDSKTVHDSASSEYQFNFNFDFTAMSPATPGFLTQPSRLTQQTCPPKQTNQGLFSSLLSGDSDGSYSGYDNTPSASSKSGAGLRLKLEAARRKSLAFKPRLGSPLSRS